MRMLTAALAAALAVGVAGAATAQNPNLSPTYGSVSLTTGFLPDPNVTSIEAGGPNNARNLGNNCRGWVYDAPDLVLDYQAGTTYPLNIYAESQADTTLVIRTPNGRWMCDDDGWQGLNPLVEMPNPSSGRYAIWVGTYSQRDDFPAADVFISELDPYGQSQQPPQSNMPDPNLPPSAGSRQLTTGFMPDPVSVNVTAGGSVNARDLGGNCRGYIDAAPDYRLDYQAGNQFPLNLYVDGNADTTLVIMDPSGRWHCNDDFNGLQPAYEFRSPQSGTYDIWVGTYSSAAGTPSTTLYISELYTSVSQGGGGGGGGGSAGDIDPNLPPQSGQRQVNTGFLPDPIAVNVTAGGSVNARDLGGTCRGYVDAAPDYRIQYQAGSTYPLNFYVDGAPDSVLVIMDPSEQIHCNDDFNGLQPAIAFNGPQSGTYDIWVGTYSSSAGPSPTTLYISELYMSASEANSGGGGGGGGQSLIDPNMPAAFGSTQLTTGFMPDPFVVRVQAGGDVEAFNVDSSCRGYIDVAPTYSVNFQSGQYPFNVFVNSQADTTLVVRDPNGRLHCNDDHNGLQAALSIQNAPSGEYDIWVGTYYSTAGFPATTLYISEVQMSP